MSALPKDLFILSGKLYNVNNAKIAVIVPSNGFIANPISVRAGIMNIGFLVLKSW